MRMFRRFASHYSYPCPISLPEGMFVLVHSSLLQHAIIGDAFDGATAHGRAHVALEALAVVAQVLCGFLVQRV